MVPFLELGKRTGALILATRCGRIHVILRFSMEKPLGQRCLIEEGEVERRRQPFPSLAALETRSNLPSVCMREESTNEYWLAYWPSSFIMYVV
jgi:hypothetical protein